MEKIKQNVNRPFLAGLICAVYISFVLIFAGCTATFWIRPYYIVNLHPVRANVCNIDGKTYYFKDNGEVATGWVQVNGALYYFDASGVQQTGRCFVDANNAWYFLYSGGGIARNIQIDSRYYGDDGQMVRNKWIDGNYYDAKGKLYRFDGVLGSRGRLYLPELGYDVALYDVPEGSIKGTAQNTVDNADSAAWMYWPTLHGEAPLVADHAGQGFFVIQRCKFGTKAIIQTEDGLETYICYAIDVKSHNEKRTDIRLIYDSYGRDVTTVYDASGFVCYTCNDMTGRNVTMVAFRPE